MRIKACMHAQTLPRHTHRPHTPYTHHLACRVWQQMCAHASKACGPASLSHVLHEAMLALLPGTATGGNMNYMKQEGTGGNNKIIMVHFSSA